MREGNTKKTIVCFGDSNTHGYNSRIIGRFTEDERWTCLLQKYLGDEYHVIEEGMEGRTTVYEDPLFEGLCGIKAMYPVLMTHKPVDLLIIMLGTNDVKQRFNSTPANIAKGLEYLVNKALDTEVAFRDYKPNILIMTPPPIEKGYETTDIYGEMGANCVEKSEALAPLYADVAKRLNCHYLDLMSIKGMCMYPYDYMHLSLESHDLLAKKLAEIVPGMIE